MWHPPPRPRCGKHNPKYTIKSSKTYELLGEEERFGRRIFTFFHELRVYSAICQKKKVKFQYQLHQIILSPNQVCTETINE